MELFSSQSTDDQTENITTLLANSEDTEVLRIHGDNVLECESALELVERAFSCSAYARESAAFAPIYELQVPDGPKYYIQLLPGYGRWGFEFIDHLYARGAPLREAADAIITRIFGTESEPREEPLVAMEFCGALPAGNNAWQRTGRALSLAHAGIPYLYFAELGGVELSTEDRSIKAPRFPNPIIPFSYLELGHTAGVASLPVFLPSPSITHEWHERFEEGFASADSISMLGKLIQGGDFAEEQKIIEGKALRVVRELTGMRANGENIVSLNEWSEIHEKKSGEAKLKWFSEKEMAWNKSISIKNRTKSIDILLAEVKEIGAFALGAGDVPFCGLSVRDRKRLGEAVEQIYNDRISESFLHWLKDKETPLVCVWIAGFKPAGEDSRPDRGLVPLVRMLLGYGDFDVLSIIYGPAPKASLQKLEEDMHELAQINGLWESILKLSDGVLVDTATNGDLANIGITLDPLSWQQKSKHILVAASDVPSFGEHDIDTVLHRVFSKNSDLCFEGMCNPPGGDWSGISLMDESGEKEWRWTSLPRVSGVSTKRPDQVFQIKHESALLVVESKETASKLESGIGPRLASYLNYLLEYSPIAERNPGDRYWHLYSGEEVNIDVEHIVTAGAFMSTDAEELKRTLKRSETDIVFGFGFDKESGNTVVHLIFSEKGNVIRPQVLQIMDRFSSKVVVQTYEVNS